MASGVTRLKCGKGGDSGGHCGWWCPSVTELGDVARYDYPGDGCGGSWHPSDVTIPGLYTRTLAFRVPSESLPVPTPSSLLYLISSLSVLSKERVNVKHDRPVES